jgi:hypothetical protein
MALVNNNLVTEGASGKLGKRLVFRHMKDGRTIMATRPDYSGHVWTPDQRTHHSRFQQAVKYARVASRANPLYGELARGTAKNAYNIALSDWFHSPVIHEVTLQDGHVRVEATDNVLVTRVVITITDEQGNTLEQGEAALVSENAWEYRTATPGNLLVAAFDLAGNVTKADVIASTSTGSV